MTKTLYVSGVSGIVGYGIVNSAKLGRHNLRVVGSCLDDFNYGAFQVDQNFIAPMTSTPGYISWLEDLISKEQILFAIPGIEVDVHTWNKNREAMLNLGCSPLLNSKDLIKLTSDKYQFFKDVECKEFSHTIPTSDSTVYQNVLEFLQSENMIAKPKLGFAKKGFQKLQNESEFDLFVAKNPTGFVFQPNLESDGFEYTSGVFGDGAGGFSASITMRRRLATAGYTEYAEVVHEPLIEEIILDYCQMYSPIGPTNFQFMRSRNQFYLLEINPRFSSSNSIRTLLGFNEVEMLLDFTLEGILPKQPKLQHSKVVRFISDAIV